MESWSEFYIAVGTGAATLTGLMFIAVTFGSKLITQRTVKAAQAFLSPIINHFGEAFILSCVALIPEQTAFLGVSCIVYSVVRMIKLRHGYYHLKNNDHPEDIDYTDWLSTLIVPLICHLSFITSGIAFLMGKEWGPYGIAISMLGLLFIGIVNAWEMLIWMAYKIEN